MPQCVEVEFCLYKRMGEYCFGLRGIQQFTVEDAIIYWFFTKTITRENQLFLSRIPQRDREHAVDMIDQIVAIDLIQMRDDLDIGLRAKFVSAPFEIRTNLAVIV